MSAWDQAYAEETIPILRYEPDGRIRNIRPSSYMREAMQDVKESGSKNIIGYIVENTYGDRKPMTFIQYRRLIDLFERGMLKVVDHWKVTHVPAEYGLSGFDTECTGSGIHSLSG